MIYNNLYDTKKIEKEIDKLQIPKEHRCKIVSLDKLFTHDYMMQLSIRQDSGKTTQALIVGLVLNKLYGTHTMYMRSDAKQITMSNIETLYNVIINCGYIDRLHDGKYNTLVYKQMEHKFYLAHEYTDTEGKYQIDISNDYVCHVVCLERWKEYKSNVNDVFADYIIFDEFMDTDRITTRQMNELQDNLSTFGRLRDACHCLMLGNNVDKFCFWFQEFCIEEEVVNLKFGGYIEKKTSLGTTFICELMRTSDEHRERVVRKNIRFSGFDTPKMNAYNGLQEWQGESHPHIPYNELLDNKPVLDGIWILHRNRYIRLKTYYDSDFGYYVFMHYSNKPQKKDAVILTLEPMAYNEVYGFADFAPQKLHRIVHKILDIIKSNRCYFATNSVGELFSNYAKEYRHNKRVL